MHFCASLPSLTTSISLLSRKPSAFAAFAAFSPSAAAATLVAAALALAGTCAAGAVHAAEGFKLEHVNTPGLSSSSAGLQELDAVIERVRREVSELEQNAKDGKGTNTGFARITIAVSNSLSADYLDALAVSARRIGARLAVRGLDVGNAAEKLAAFVPVNHGVAKRSSGFAGMQGMKARAGAGEKASAAHAEEGNVNGNVNAANPSVPSDAPSMTFAELPYFSLPPVAQQAYRGAIRAGMVAMAQKTAAAGFEIDPEFFGRYEVKAVPVVVVEMPEKKEEKQDGESSQEKTGKRAMPEAANPMLSTFPRTLPRSLPGVSCAAAGKPSIVYIVRGAVSLDWALTHLAARARDLGKGEDAARLDHLARLAAGDDALPRTARVMVDADANPYANPYMNAAGTAATDMKEAR